MAGLLLTAGFVSGSYPAIFLSSLQPIRVLKGSLRFSGGATFFRKGLVVFQFTLSMMFLVGMIVIYRQMDYIQTKNLGYDRENLVYLPLEGDLAEKYALFKMEADKSPGILAVSKIRQAPTALAYPYGRYPSGWGRPPSFSMTLLSFNTDVGYDFVKTMKLEAGGGSQSFSRDFSHRFE